MANKFLTEARRLVSKPFRVASGRSGWGLSVEVSPGQFTSSIIGTYAEAWKARADKIAELADNMRMAEEEEAALPDVI